MLLEARGISVAFGGIKAVENVSFGVQRGEIFTIIGPNGAGKTTIFNLVSRIYQANEGEILLDGKAITRVEPQMVARLGIARTFQNIELFDNATVVDNILVGCHVKGQTSIFSDLLFLPSAKRQEMEFRRSVEEIIEFLELERHRTTPISALSYGVRKVVEIGRALAIGPRLLLLDEPSSGLNPEETDDMAHWIRDIREDLGVTIVMVEHDMSLVRRVSDRVLALDAGRVLALGGPAEVISHPEVVRAYLGD